MYKLITHIAALLAQRLSLASLAFSLTVISANSFADDTEIYSLVERTPQILFVLDVSQSMDNTDPPEFTTSRLQRLREAMSLLLGSLEGVDVGLMTFALEGGDLLHPIVNITENRDVLRAATDGLLDTELKTPTVAALYEASRYFNGETPYRGVLPAGSTHYENPRTTECQSSHIILLTDGRPTTDPQVAEDLNPILGSCALDDAERGACGIELAANLAGDPGAGPDVGITTHAIGFNLRDDWLENVAAAGGGEYRDANSADELVQAIQEILGSVALTATAAAPSISVSAFNESRHRDELYYSFFQPEVTPRWHGNVKKYRLLDGQVVDGDDRPLITAEGVVDADTRSFWSVANDGMQVRDGGFAALQPKQRNWFTDTGAADTSGDINAISVIENSDIEVSWVDAGSDDERNTIVGFVRGADVLDQNGNGITDEPNHFVADALHSSPVLLSYRAKAATETSEAELNEVIFSANNMGVLHAVDAQTGAEKWSYSPRELLPNIKMYIDNTSEKHVYGLDGSMVVHTTFKPETTYDYEVDDAYLYLSQRRGGRGIFALDVSNGFNTTDPFEVMWKINGATNIDYRDLGQTWATPQVIPVRFGCPDNCVTKEVLMFGGGYDPIYDDVDLTYPAPPAVSGRGNAVYFADLETGELIWSVGNGAHHDLNLPMNDSVPETPVPVDTDADGVVDILFFSDIAGHVWRVDIDGDAVSADQLALSGGLIASLAPAVGGVTQPLRFSNRIDVVINGTTVSTASFNLVLGTGIRSSPLHVESALNRLYSIRDPWVFTNPVGDERDADGNALAEYRYVVDSENDTRDIITTDALIEFVEPTENATTTAPAIDNNFGFYKVLTGIGEKILQPTLTHDGRIFLISFVPPDPSTIDNICDYQLGESRLQIIDLVDGTNLLPDEFRPYLYVGPGIVPNGSIVDTGQSGGPDFVLGINSEKLVDLLKPDSPNIFRRFYRTGWTELDE